MWWAADANWVVSLPIASLVSYITSWWKLFMFLMFKGISSPTGAVMSSLCFLSSLLIVAHVAGLEFRYHSNHEIENFLLHVNASNPDITHLYSIGRSIRGKHTHRVTLSSPRCVTRKRWICFIFHLNELLFHLSYFWIEPLKRTLCVCACARTCVWHRLTHRDVMVD